MCMLCGERTRPHCVGQVHSLFCCRRNGHEAPGGSPWLSNSPGKLLVAQLVPGGRCAHNACTGGGAVPAAGTGVLLQGLEAAGEPEPRGQPAEPGSCGGAVQPWPAQLLKQQQWSLWSLLCSPECGEGSGCDLHVCTQVCN